jgi:DNA recombination protein RmuC
MECGRRAFAVGIRIYLGLIQSPTMGETMSLPAGLLVLLVVSAAVGAAALVAILALARKRSTWSESLSLIQQQMDALRGDLARHVEQQSSRFDRAQGSIGERLDQASRNIADVGRQLALLESATDRVLEVGQSVSSIENILRAPKLRGVLGELLLGETLRQSLPPALFELQYLLKSGERVDAVVRVGDGLLPVDAKFPLDNLRRSMEAQPPSEKETFLRAFRRDFRKHVDDIASKYIAPDCGTLPMAFLYVPAENVYQQAVLGDWSLAEYALGQRVIPTGPLGFYAFLQTVLVGSRTLAASERSGAILAGLEEVAVELQQIGPEVSKLNRHIELAQSNVETVAKRFERLSKAFTRARNTLNDNG